MKKFINKRAFSLVTIIIAFLWIVFAIINFIYSLNDIQLKEQSKNLEEITKSNAVEINYTIEKYTQILLSAVTFIETYEDIASEEVLDKLKEVASKNDFTRLSVDFVDGMGYTSDGKIVDNSQFNYSDKIKEGEPFVLDVIDAIIDGEPTISILVPIKDKDGTYNAALRGTIETAKFGKMLEETFSKGGGYFHVVDETGRYVAKSNATNELLAEERSYFQAIEKLEFEEGYSAEQIKKLFIQKEKGISKYSYQGQERYCYFEPSNINKWMVMTIIPKEIAESNINKHIANVAKLVIQMLVVFLFFVIYIYITQKNTNKLFQKNQEQLTKLAYYDEFTAAPTLAKFRIEAQKFIEDNKDKKFLLVKLDIKEFKLLNRILGNKVGDTVILNMAKALKANTDKGYELYARLHDDEFLVLHTYQKEGENLLLKENFRRLVYQYMGEDFTYDFKIVSGHYYMTEDNCTHITEAIEKANIAHRMAKQTGSGICLYDKEFITNTLKQKEIEGRADSAIENYELKVYLQPKYEIENEMIVGAEALVRWIDDSGKITFPNDFIPVFEQNGFITKLDFYMFEETCKIIRGWMNKGIKPIPVSVNFSRLHLSNPKFLSTLLRLADQYNVPTKYLEIELTETIVMDTHHDLAAFIASLHGVGFLVSMDDFGTGYSSLGMLKNLNVDIIKLDRSFFLEAHENAKAHSILSNMINMAIDLGISTVAEGVEEKEHVELLRKLNCDMIQGYYFGRPMPAIEFTQLLQKEAVDNAGMLEKANPRQFNLRKNNELLTDMLDSMPLAFVLWDKDNKMIQCNKETATLLGFMSEAEFIANWEKTVPEKQPDGQASLQMIIEQIQFCFSNGHKQNFTWVLRHKDGTQLPCEMILVRIFNKGEFMIAGYLRDMRLQLEADNIIKQEHLSLKVLNDEYKQLLDHNPLCINIWNNDKLIMCTKAVCSMFDIESEEIYRERFYEFSPEYQPDGVKSSEKVIDNFNKVCEKGVHSFRWMHQKLNGELVPVEIMMVLITLNGEQMVAAFVRDIRLQLEAENAIKQEYVKLKAMMDASPLCFNLWTEEMENTMCNKAAIALFDLADEQEYLTRFLELSPEYQPDGNLSAEKAELYIKKAFEEGGTVFEWMHQKLNGEEILAEITLNRIELDGKPFIAGFTRDLRKDQKR